VLKSSSVYGCFEACFAAQKTRMGDLALSRETWESLLLSFLVWRFDVVVVMFVWDCVIEIL